MWRWTVQLNGRMDQAMVGAMVQSMDVAMDGNGWMVRDRAQIKNWLWTTRGQDPHGGYRRGGITKEAASQSGHDAGPGINFSFTTPTGKQRNILRLKRSMLTKYDKKKASFSATGGQS